MKLLFAYKTIHGCPVAPESPNEPTILHRTTIQGTRVTQESFRSPTPTMQQLNITKTASATLLLFIFCFDASVGFLQGTCDAGRGLQTCGERFRHLQPKNKREISEINRQHERQSLVSNDGREIRRVLHPDAFSGLQRDERARQSRIGMERNDAIRSAGRVDAIRDSRAAETRRNTERRTQINREIQKTSTNSRTNLPVRKERLDELTRDTRKFLTISPDRRHRQRDSTEERLSHRREISAPNENIRGIRIYNARTENRNIVSSRRTPINLQYSEGQVRSRSNIQQNRQISRNSLDLRLARSVDSRRESERRVDTNERETRSRSFEKRNQINERRVFDDARRVRINSEDNTRRINRDSMEERGQLHQDSSYNQMRRIRDTDERRAVVNNKRIRSDLESDRRQERVRSNTERKQRMSDISRRNSVERRNNLNSNRRQDTIRSDVQRERRISDLSRRISTERASVEDSRTSTIRSDTRINSRVRSVEDRRLQTTEARKVDDRRTQDRQSDERRVVRSISVDRQADRASERRSTRILRGIDREASSFRRNAERTRQEIRSSERTDRGNSETSRRTRFAENRSVNIEKRSSSPNERREMPGRSLDTRNDWISSLRSVRSTNKRASRDIRSRNTATRRQNTDFTKEIRQRASNERQVRRLTPDVTLNKDENNNDKHFQNREMRITRKVDENQRNTADSERKMAIPFRVLKQETENTPESSGLWLNVAKTALLSFLLLQMATNSKMRKYR